MPDMSINVERINAPALDQELRTALPTKCRGLSFHGGVLRVHLTADAGSADQTTVAQIVAAHDPDVLTTAQQTEQAAASVKAAAKTQAQNVPNWARWDEATTITWLQTHVTDLASAKTALINLTRMVIALRNEIWPDLEA